MDAILTAHGLERADVEPKVLSRCFLGYYTEEDMERVARVSSTNKKLNIKGLPGLLLFPDEENISLKALPVDSNLIEKIASLAEKNLNEDDLKICSTSGLTTSEYFVIKGNHGTVLGLHLEKAAFNSALKSCQTKTAKLAKQKDEDDSKQFVYTQIKSIAKRKLKNRNSLESLFFGEEKTEGFDFLDKHFGNKKIQEGNNLLKSMMQSPSS